MLRMDMVHEGEVSIVFVAKSEEEDVANRLVMWYGDQ
jgi:hypothetical protein